MILLSPVNTAVAISTYAMVAYTQKRAWDSQQVGPGEGNGAHAIV